MILGMESVQLLAREASENSSFGVRLHERSSRGGHGLVLGLRWHRRGCVLLLLLAFSLIPGAAIDSCLASLSWLENQTSHQNSLSAPNMLRRSMPDFRWFWKTSFLFFPAVFPRALQTSVGHNCLSELSAEAAFLGEEVRHFMSYEKTLKQLMHLSGDVS